VVALLKDIVRVLELSSQLVVKPFILVQPSLDMILLTTISTVAALGVVIIEDISQFYSKMNLMWGGKDNLLQTKKTPEGVLFCIINMIIWLLSNQQYL